MNFYRGLLRLVQVFWGFVGLCLIVIFALDLKQDGDWARAFTHTVFSLTAAYGLYRLTVWIMDGFAKSKP